MDGLEWKTLSKWMIWGYHWETSICSTFFHTSSALWWLQFFTQDDSQAHCSSSGEASKWRRCAAIPSLIGIRDLHASISISGTNIGTESQWGFNWFSIVFKSFCNSKHDVLLNSALFFIAVHRWTSPMFQNSHTTNTIIWQNRIKFK